MKQLYSEKDVERAASRLSCEIAAAYSPSETSLSFIGILTGGADFMFRLLNYVRRDHEISYTYGFMAISSYRDSKTSITYPKVSYCSIPSLRDSVVIIVDDIVDRGNTIKLAKEHIKLFDPKKIETVSLLLKVGAEYEPDRFGLIVERDDFVVGTGMGLGDKHRDKPGIWILDDASIKETV